MQKKMYPAGDNWQRVSRAIPCPICGKPKYCAITPDGSAVMCMKIADGAFQTKRNGGFLHKLADKADKRSIRPRVRVISARVQTNFQPMQIEIQKEMSRVRLSVLSNRLGVSMESLKRMRVGWYEPKSAWSFPMWDCDGRIIGYRLRLANGRKLAIRGGREGLFIPDRFAETGLSRLLVTEGPTDCAALLDLGFEVVGRPSCMGGVKLLIELMRRHKPEEVVIVSDGDEPGRRGAEHLAVALIPYVRALRVICPPDGVKDAREWKRAGLKAGELLAAIQAVEVRKLEICGRLAGEGVRK